jgi:hypothetical protein
MHEAIGEFAFLSIDLAMPSWHHYMTLHGNNGIDTSLCPYGEKSFLINVGLSGGFFNCPMERFADRLSRKYRWHIYNPGPD